MLFNLNGKDGILGTTGLGGLIRGIGNRKQNAANKSYIEQLTDTILSTGDLIAPDLRGKIDRKGTKEEWGISDEVLDSVIEIGEKYHTASEQAEALKGKMGELGSVGSRLTGVLKSIGSTLLNGLASFGISLGISAAISGISSLVDHWVNASKYIQKAAKKAREAIANLQSELKTTTDTVDIVKQRYALNDALEMVHRICQYQVLLRLF